MLEAYLTGIASSLAYDGIKGIGKVAFSRVWRSVPATFNNETRITLQRGIYRAMLRSTLCHLAELNEIKLADIDLEETDVHIPRPEIHYKALNRLICKLQRGIDQLNIIIDAPQSTKYLEQLTKYQHVITEFNIDLPDQKVANIANAFLVSSQDSEPTDHYIDWQSAIDTSLGEFSHAMVKMMVVIGKWKPDRINAIEQFMLENMFSANGNWFKTYALCFLDEVSQDKVLFRQNSTLNFLNSNTNSQKLQGLIRGLEVGVDAKLKDIELVINRTHQDVKSAIDLLRKEFKLNDRIVFATLVPSNQTAYSEMYFATEKDKFIGREDTIEIIQDGFLSYSEDSPDFKWLSLAGEAGTGKSRLALELISRFRQQWRVAGFVTAKFLREAKLESIHPSHISSPTLFVIDYATRFINQTVNFLARCAELTGSVAYPIRVILIMRRPDEQLINTLQFETDYTCVYNYRFPQSDDNPDQQDGIITLGELGDDQIYRLMRARLGQERKSIGKQQLIKYLEQYDRRKRPLIAALVADALRNDALQTEDGDDNETNRLRLFYEYLSRNYINRWKYVGEQKSPGELSTEGAKQIDKHIALMLLSTMVRGVTDSSLDLLYDCMPDACMRLLPNRPCSPILHNECIDLDEEGILATLLGTIRAEDDPYPPLEPDLVGESMVVHFLLGKTSGLLPPNSKLKGKNRQIITEMAWRCSAEATAYFASMVAQDFPDHAERLNWLLPDNNALVTPFSRSLLIRNVLAGIIVEWRSNQVKLSTMMRLEKLLKLVRFAKTHSNSARENTAQSLEQISLHLAKLVNQNVVLPEKSLSQLENSGSDNSITTLNKREEEIFNHASKRKNLTIKKVSSVTDFAEVSPSKELIGREGDIEEKFESSNKEIVQLAINLLVKLFKIASRHLWSEPNFRIRRNLIDALVYVLVSALWSKRHLPEYGGNAQFELSKVDKKLRHDILIQCNKIIKSDCKIEDLATGTTIIARLLYADESIELSMLDEIYEVIKKKIAENMSSYDGLVLQGILDFFSNYLVVQRKALENIENKESSQFIYLLKNIKESMSVAHKLFCQLHDKDLDVRSYRSSVAAISNCYIKVVGSNEIYMDKQKLDFTEECWNFMFPYLLNQDKVILSQSEVQLILVINQPSKLVRKKNFHAQLLKIFETINFDQSSLCVGTNTIRAEFMGWLVFDFQEEFNTALRKFILQVGLRAGSDLLKLIVKRVPSHTVNEKHVDGLLSVLYDHEIQKSIDQEKLHISLLHLWSQYLLLDKMDKLAGEIMAFWPDGEEVSHYKARELAFEGVRMLARWTSPVDQLILSFIPKIVIILKQENFVKTLDSSITEPHVHAHHLSLIELISDLVRMGLSRNENVDQFLYLKEQLNGK